MAARSRHRRQQAATGIAPPSADGTKQNRRHLRVACFWGHRSPATAIGREAYSFFAFLAFFFLAGLRLAALRLVAVFFFANIFLALRFAFLFFGAARFFPF